MSDNFQVNKQFAKFKGKDVIVGLKNWEEIEGKVVTLDNFLNLVLDDGEGLRVIKGGKIAFISVKE
ncbi:MAG: LSM domain protein [Methanobacteriaceae archaeon]|nr:LSM domain protein [Methanobacteriaceae archaeon]